EQAAGRPTEQAADRPGEQAAGRPTEQSGRVRPAQLPPDVPVFTGRARQLGALALLLSDRRRRTTVGTCAIVGTAGGGKTTLAVPWAHRVRRRFPNGQLYLDLRGHAAGPAVRPVEALAQFLRALGVPPGEVPADESEAVGLYRSLVADRRVLVLLDNAHG